MNFLPGTHIARISPTFTNRRPVWATLMLIKAWNLKHVEMNSLWQVLTICCNQRFNNLQDNKLIGKGSKWWKKNFFARIQSDDYESWWEFTFVLCLQTRTNVNGTKHWLSLFCSWNWQIVMRLFLIVRLNNFHIHFPIGFQTKLKPHNQFDQFAGKHRLCTVQPNKCHHLNTKLKELRTRLRTFNNSFDYENFVIKTKLETKKFFEFFEKIVFCFSKICN